MNALARTLALLALALLANCAHQQFPWNIVRHEQDHCCNDFGICDPKKWRYDFTPDNWRYCQTHGAGFDAVACAQKWSDGAGGYLCLIRLPENYAESKHGARTD